MRCNWLVICAFLASAAMAADLPGDSFANFSKPVRKEIEKNLKMYLSKKHGCKRYDVQDTRTIKQDEELLVDAKRRLIVGAITEEWEIEACGKALVLTLVIAADGAGKGETFLAIAERAAHTAGT